MKNIDYTQTRFHTIKTTAPAQKQGATESNEFQKKLVQLSELTRESQKVISEEITKQKDKKPLEPKIIKEHRVAAPVPMQAPKIWNMEDKE